MLPEGYVLEFARWILGGLCLVIFSLIALGNCAVAWNWFVHHKRGSMFPVFGGLLGAIGVLLLPIENSSQWWWLPPLLDLGCVPIVIIWLVAFLGRYFRYLKS